MARVTLRLAVGAALLCLAAITTAVGTAQRTAGPTDWPSTNFNQNANRYSPLTQITKSNVSTLERAWSIHLKPAGFVGRMREDEAIPIVIGNTMYLASPYGVVIALDATTGAEKWRFQLPNNDTPSRRGVAYWPGGGTTLALPPSIIVGTATGGLYSLNAESGKPNEWFGENGVTNMKTSEVMQTGPNVPYSLLSSATIYKDLIITGAGTGEGPGGSNGGAGPAGDTRAWDARTGKLAWTFHSIPRPGEFGYDTWGKDSAKNRSGVNVWGYTSLDAERGILYMPLGAPNNDRVGIDRPGNNLYSSSVVAVDANTGKYLWHFQVVHHDIWDYDTQSAPLLVDLHRNGAIVPAVIIVNKTGLMFTLNRVTGAPLFDIEERPVPKSDVPGEQASPTQPFPVKPEPLSQNTISRNNLYKGEPQLQSYCEHLVDDNNMKLGGPYMPIALNRYSISPPGPAGGINFWGPAYDPDLHLFISNVNNIFQPMRLVLQADGSYLNSGPLAGTRRFGDPERHLLCGPTPWGELVAVNMDTGNIAYRKTLGVSDALPAGMQDTGRPSSGGVMLTASGLTFVGGTDDFRFRAFATATGEKLWEIKLSSSIETTPITYQGADGRQFVAVVSTGGGLTGSQVTNDEIIAFGLPLRRQQP
jgi:quinoprotein glucose dehydrogenase